MSTLLLRAIANRGAKTDDRGLVLLLASLGNRVVDSFEVTKTDSVSTNRKDYQESLRIAVVDVQNLPAV